MVVFFICSVENKKKKEDKSKAEDESKKKSKSTPKSTAVQPRIDAAKYISIF